MEMFKNKCMWHLGTRFGGEYGGAEGMVGLHGLGGLFQLKLFYDSVILRSADSEVLSQK